MKDSQKIFVLAIIYFLTLNSCGIYYFTESYKIKYASPSIRGGTEFQMTPDDLLLLDGLISEVCKQYDLDKISINKANEKIHNEFKGHILFAYCSNKDSIEFNLVWFTEYERKQWLNHKKISFYYYYLYFQSYSKNGEKAAEYTDLKSEIIQRFRNDFGKKFIINVNKLGPPSISPLNQEKDSDNK